MLTTSTVDSRRVYRDHRVTMRVDTVRLGDRPAIERGVIEQEDSVVVVPVTDDARVLLVRQWRHAAQSVLLEAPAGHIRSGETPLEAAGRELREEAGHAAARFAPLVGFWAAPSISTEYMHGFVASGLRRSSLPQDEDEHVELAPTPLTEVPRLIREGAIIDAKSIAALLAALHLPGAPALPGNVRPS